MKLRLLSLIVIVTISTSFVKAQMPGWSYVEWFLTSNTSGYVDSLSMKPLFYPEKAGIGISNVTIGNGYETISTNNSWPSVVDTNTNNTYLEFTSSGCDDPNFPGNGLIWSPIALQFNGYVDNISDSALFSIYVVDTSYDPFPTDSFMSSHYHYFGNISINSTDSSKPTKAFIMLAYKILSDTVGGKIYIDTISFFQDNIYSYNYSVRLYPVKGKNIHINDVVVNAWAVEMLPIKLVSFNVQGFNTFNSVRWQTATETNNAHFNVQRSTDGISFTTIGSENAKGASSYSYIDNSFPKGVLYYRLQIVDKDGALSYSDIRELSITNSSLSIAPNPARDIVTISGSNIKQVSILDLYGRTVITREMNTNTINVSVNNLSKGIYMVKAIHADGSINTEKLLVE